MDSVQSVQNNLRENCLKIIEEIKLKSSHIGALIPLSRNDDTTLFEYVGTLDKVEKDLLQIAALLQKVVVSESID